MKEIGVITYHSAYNYGSVLQAYATQCVLEDLGFKARIINYRMDEQKQYYSLYRIKFGKRNFLNDLSQIPIEKKRKIRQERFEQFFNYRLNLTKMFREPSEFLDIASDFEIIISGSDQIWNKHSCELNWNSWKYMEPYLLKNVNCKKISYASSIGNMSEQELKYIADDLNQFQYIAMREQSSAKKIAELLNKSVGWVVDPTLLLECDQWIQRLSLSKKIKDPYILYYSLSGFDRTLKMRHILNQLAAKMACKLYIVTPYIFFPSINKNIEIHPEFGPLEFMEALYNASLIVTDSYHGTILSVNFEKDFYSLCGNSGSEFRKTDILNGLGLEARIIHNVNDIIKQKYKPIDYLRVNEKKEKLVRHSLDYLKYAIIQ